MYFQSASSHMYATDKENAALTSTKIFMCACGQNKMGRLFPLAELHLGKQAVMKHSDEYGPNNFELFIIVNTYQSWHVHVIKRVFLSGFLEIFSILYTMLKSRMT